MIVSRAVEGEGIGILSAVVPVYLSECFPMSIRGSISSLFQIIVTFGILLSYLVTLGFNRHSEIFIRREKSENWRYLFGIQYVFSLFLTILLIPTPHSPRGLVDSGKNEEAKNTLIQTRHVKIVGRKKAPMEDG